MDEAADYCIPVYKPGIHKHWWTPELDELKQQCIQATDIWKQLGRPRSGDVNTNRVRCKLRYTRMWANAQPDGRPAEHRWRPLFNAAKFG